MVDPMMDAEPELAAPPEMAEVDESSFDPMTAPSMEDVFEALKLDAPAALSEERGERNPADSDPSVVSALGDTLELPEESPETKIALATLYGPTFPLLTKEQKEEDWVKWGVATWDDYGPGVQRRMHLVERNRLYRLGIQWISSSGFGPWREPPRSKDTSRIVENMVAPALNQRIQVITEQRPGFRVRPTTNDPDDLRRANAKQRALEYQYDQQGMPEIIREAAYWAGTDGVSFMELFWDPDRGPWHETHAKGQEEEQPEEETPQGPMGDVSVRVRRIEQVRVSPNATATRKPWLWAIRDVMSQAEAIQIYGEGVADENGTPDRPDALLSMNYPLIRQGYALPAMDEMLLNQKIVERFTIYCDKSMGLPKGLTMVIVGQKLVHIGPLMFGAIPMVRVTDGFPDPAFYSSAEMEMWIECQQRINAVKSRWVDNIRLNAGPKLLAKENAISMETFVAGNMSVIGVKGLGGLSEIARPLESFSIGVDAKELLAAEIKRFEDLSGWNDTSRGQFASDQSGRAILAIREQLERVFAPAVNACAKAMTEWGKVSCSIMAWGYDYPRFLGVEGSNRPDLAEAVMNDDMDGVTDVFVDPETLMPMPQSLRLFLIKDMFQTGMMGIQEARRRMPFANVRDLSTPDEDQEARAQRVCQAIKQSGDPMALPLLWQDDESIHQDVLQRTLILPDDVPYPIRMAANQRWMMLAQQAQMKAMQLPPSGGGEPQGGQPGQAQGLSPKEKPLAGTNPGVATKPNSMGDGDKTVQDFESRQKTMEQR